MGLEKGEIGLAARGLLERRGGNLGQGHDVGHGAVVVGVKLGDRGPEGWARHQGRDAPARLRARVGGQG